MVIAKLMLVLPLLPACAPATRATPPSDARRPTPPALALPDDVLLVDRSALHERMTRACKQGELASCVLVLGTPDLVLVHTVAEQVLRPHCLAGNVWACRHAAKGLPLRVGDIQRLCDANVPYACASYASALDLLPDDRVSSKEVEDALLRACRMGEPEPCRRAANGERSSPLYKRAEELSAIGCEAGFALDCVSNNMGPRGVTSCLAGDAGACLVAKSENLDQQIQLETIGCVINSDTCTRAASSLLQRNATGDVLRARRALAITCDARWRAPESRASACREAARLLERAPADPEGAKHAYQRACELSPATCSTGQPEESKQP